MHTAVSILLAGVLTVHSVCGLCWHCVDAEASCPKTPAATTVCNCHRAAEVPSGSDAFRDADSCCQFECTGTCHYLQIERVTIEQSADTLWIAALPVDGSAIQPQTVFDIFERGAIAHGGYPPLRLHLVHGLLLI
jgi:hypothetical protein